MSTAISVKKYTACNRDCPDACGIIATVESGRITRLQGDPDHPITRGFPLPPDEPLFGSAIRPRAVDHSADPPRFGIRARFVGGSARPDRRQNAADPQRVGGAAILHYRCGGSLGIMKHVTDYFFERFGPVTVKSGDICSGAGEAAQLTDFGESDSHDLFDLLNSKTIVIWGKNLHVSSVHLLPVVREAQKKGTRLILVDPVHHQTANLCEQYLQPRPGGDAALALGVARWLFEHGQTDPAASSYCDNLAEFRSLALSRSLDEWGQCADVSPAEIEALAAAYANGPSAILVGWGMQRRTYGSSTIRVLDALAAVSGNLGIPGGGISFYYKRRGAFDLSFVQGEAIAPRTIPEPLLGPGILEASNPPIRMVWITAANPVAMLPESNTVARALAMRELTVAVDSFLTDSARCAHVVLPTTTMLEEDDLLGCLRPPLARRSAARRRTARGGQDGLRNRAGSGEENRPRRRLFRGRRDVETATPVSGGRSRGIVERSPPGARAKSLCQTAPLRGPQVLHAQWPSQLDSRSQRSAAASPAAVSPAADGVLDREIAIVTVAARNAARTGNGRRTPAGGSGLPGRRACEDRIPDR